MTTHLENVKENSNKKLIYFLCNGFPTVSETFVTGQILNAINNGFMVNIHADYINHLDRPLFEKYPLINDMLSKTYTRHHVPDNKINRIFFAFALAKNKSSLPALASSLNIFRFGVNALSLRDFFSYSSFFGKEEPNLIHAQFGPNGVKAINAKLNNVIRCPIITSFHGYDAHAEPSKFEKIRRYYSKLFKYGDLFLVNGDYLKSQLLKLGCPDNKIIKLPFGVDLNSFKPSSLRPDIRKGEVKFITVGRLVKLKNQKFGIRLLNLLRSEGINASYTIIGDGPEIENLKKLSKNLNVEESVHFLGSLPQDKILKILPNHHIFLMTSYKDEAGRMETQGIVSAEAQACGLPVITLGFGGTSDTILHGVTGYNISSSKPEAAVKYFKKLSEPSQYDDFSVNAREFIAKHYNIKTTNNCLIKIYEKLINSNT